MNRIEEISIIRQHALRDNQHIVLICVSYEYFMELSMELAATCFFPVNNQNEASCEVFGIPVEVLHYLQYPEIWKYVEHPDDRIEVFSYNEG